MRSRLLLPAACLAAAVGLSACTATATETPPPGAETASTGSPAAAAAPAESSTIDRAALERLADIDVCTWVAPEAAAAPPEILGKSYPTVTTYGQDFSVNSDGAKTSCQLSAPSGDVAFDDSEPTVLIDYQPLVDQSIWPSDGTVDYLGYRGSLTPSGARISLRDHFVLYVTAPAVDTQTTTTELLPLLWRLVDSWNANLVPSFGDAPNPDNAVRACTTVNLDSAASAIDGDVAESTFTFKSSRSISAAWQTPDAPEALATISCARSDGPLTRSVSAEWYLDAAGVQQSIGRSEQLADPCVSPVASPTPAVSCPTLNRYTSGSPWVVRSTVSSTEGNADPSEAQQADGLATTALAGFSGLTVDKSAHTTDPRLIDTEMSETAPVGATCDNGQPVWYVKSANAEAWGCMAPNGTGYKAGQVNGIAFRMNTDPGGSTGCEATPENLWPTANGFTTLCIDDLSMAVTSTSQFPPVFREYLQERWGSAMIFGD